jgi:hypothetical protein
MNKAFRIKPVVNLMKLFWRTLMYSFCKLGLFIAMQQILYVLIKRSTFQIRVSKFTPK